MPDADLLTGENYPTSCLNSTPCVHSGRGSTETNKMIPDLDIYRSANLLVKQHGEDAPIHAAMRADAMLEAGDLDGYAVWRRILRAVEELGLKQPADIDQVH